MKYKNIYTQSKVMTKVSRLYQVTRVSITYKHNHGMVGGNNAVSGRKLAVVRYDEKLA